MGPSYLGTPQKTTQVGAPGRHEKLRKGRYIWG